MVGHSAGAHLCAMALFRRAAAAAAGGLGDARMPALACLANGVYDIAQHYVYETWRGVQSLSTMERAMGGAAAFPLQSPALILHQALDGRLDCEC